LAPALRSTQPSTPSQYLTRSQVANSAVRPSLPHSLLSQPIILTLTDPETSVDSVPEVEAAKKAEEGEKTAEKIRYGQSLSENGMGGQTTGLGQANSSSAGSKAQDVDEDAKNERIKSGYGGDKDMDRDIGA
jgi:hypothetical protein